MENIIIPDSLQITMDDVGWFNGADDRQNGGSAHTGMTRRHCAEDYAAINELGRRLGMRINCGFILGEWDDDNRLGKIKYLSKYGDNWNNAAYLGRDEMKAVADTINASPYIDIAVHGLLHNYYKPGLPYSNSDYFYRLDDGLHMTPESEIRARLDAFYDMLDHHGINQKPNSFIPPTFAYIWNTISRILADYGIKYVSTVFSPPTMEVPEGFERPHNAGVENGIITVDRNIRCIPWYEISSDLDGREPVTGIFGCHWPNVLHEDPSRHGEIIDNWVRYFERCAETYGIILSRDIAFAAAQTLYKEYAETAYSDGTMTIDISKVPEAEGIASSFFISARSEIKAYSGCELSLYERKNGFINYEVRPQSDVMTFGV